MRSSLHDAVKGGSLVQDSMIRWLVLWSSLVFGLAVLGGVTG